MRKLLNVFLLVAFAVPTLAQSNYAVVTGAVTDEQNLPVAGAAIPIDRSQHWCNASGGQQPTGPV